MTSELPNRRRGRPEGSAMTDNTPAAPLLARVADTHTARQTASALHDQAIRDAAAAGHPRTEIARAMGVSGRQKIYAAIERESEPAAPPVLPPVVFLRGAKVSAATWAAIEQAMHQRGLITVRDRTQAWHLARGGAPVVLVDFTGGEGMIARVRARWRITDVTGPVGALLPRAERERLAGAGWLQVDVTTEERDTELPVIDPDSVRRFTGPIEAEQLARWAVEQAVTHPRRPSSTEDPSGTQR